MDLKYLSHLRSLRLHFVADRGDLYYLNFFPLLMRCTQLEELVIGGAGALSTLNQNRLKTNRCKKSLSCSLIGGTLAQLLA